MPDKISLIVDASSIRLDQFLVKKIPSVSRAKIQQVIKKGKILVDGERVKASTILKGAEKIEGELFLDDPIEVKGENIPLDIIFEDESIIVINKKPGMVVHLGNGNYNGTLVNALVYHFENLSDINITRPGIVHRLDKETSGVIVVAKTNQAHRNLSDQFANRKVKKVYKALVWGSLDSKGVIEGLIGRHHIDRKKFKMVNSNGRTSLTNYFLDEQLPPLSWITLIPKTGRTHQIRVHLNSIGHPIISDSTYGGGKKMKKSFHVKYNQLLNQVLKSVNRVALHAERLEISHPNSGRKLELNAPIPIDMQNALDILRNAQA